MGGRILISGCGSHVTECRIPRNRFGLAANKDSKTGSTLSPRLRFAWPTIAAAALPGPYRPLSLAADSPCTNSTSPTGLISSGPSARYIDRASINTVETTLWPLVISAASS